MDQAVSGLPPRVAEAASDNLGSGLAAAQRLHDAGLAEAAQNAFMSGMHVAAIAAAGVALLGSLVALLVIPAHERTHAHAHSDAEAVPA